ncbi:MAG: GTPase ObgE [Bdellovibrionaceae bacterium]|nr:GTPase ObgE [Pseudobdellovibrionaceae bacterium]
MKFIDEVTITVSSGKGGAGSVSFRREAMEPRGGPDGGDGGRGGNVVFRVNPQINSLLVFRFKKKYAAANGQDGSGRNMSGAAGQDLVLEVPAGTVVKDEDGQILFDLNEPGETLFLSGGRGGKGNTFFKSSVNQAPEHAQPGELGEARTVSLELKLIADVGVIGYPNAGKSTFISRISAAKPKIADYPFTTLSPNLGVVAVDGGERSFVVADIPGLVPGAHKGVGLGTQFLRHIERTNLFVHLVDASESAGREALQDYKDINHELAEYDKSKADVEGYRPLATRPQIVVLNKIDVLSEDRRRELRDGFQRAGIEVRMISAVAGIGVRELVFEMGSWVFGAKHS